MSRRTPFSIKALVSRFAFFLCVWLIVANWKIADLPVGVAALLCVPKTLSVLMTPRNHLSWRNDRAPVFRRGGLGLTIQVEYPA
jgi:hypothetical protein